MTSYAPPVARCLAAVGGTTTALDQTWLDLEPAGAGSNASSASIALQAGVHLSKGGGEVMQCASLRRPGGPITNVVVRYRQLDAVQVDSLTRSS